MVEATGFKQSPTGHTETAKHAPRYHGTIGLSEGQAPRTALVEERLWASADGESSGVDLQLPPRSCSVASGIRGCLELPAVATRSRLKVLRTIRLLENSASPERARPDCSIRDGVSPKKAAKESSRWRQELDSAAAEHCLETKKHS